LALMPAIVRDVLGMGEAGLGMAMSTIGIGAVAALMLMSQVRDEGRKLWAVRTSMLMFGLGLLALGFARSPWMAFPLFAAIGMAAITQFNTTNTLFQIWTPDRLRGRVLAMHVWALSGLNPIGAILFGWIASAWGVPFAIQSSGMCVLLIALWGWRQRGVLLPSRQAGERVAKLPESAPDVVT
jgi:predicted MFS family arabinose efflux permease